jgi:steroid delta-isomerase-like uncharacterized protein
MWCFCGQRVVDCLDKTVCGCAFFRRVFFCSFLRFIFRKAWPVDKAREHEPPNKPEDDEFGTALLSVKVGLLRGSRIRRKSRVEKGESLMQDNRAIVGRFIEETINQGQIDSAAQFVWEDVVEQVPFPGQGPGLEGLKDTLRGMRSAFPDLYFSVEEQMADGDKVLTRFEWTGTQQGEFVGIPATGHSVKVWGMVIDRLEEGRIKETRIIWICSD